MGRVKRFAAGVAAVALATACAAQAPASLRQPAAVYGPPIALPAPAVTGGMSLNEALATRRSARSFTSALLSDAQLGQLLWAGQGITSPDGKRAAPSAGGLYPVEMYVVTRKQLWHYLPSGHRVQIRSLLVSREELQSAAFDQPAVGAAPQMLLITVVDGRVTAKYGTRGHAYADMEAGHAAQNVLLQATALGLAAVPVGGVDARRCAALVGLPPDERVVYLIPVGFPL